MSVFITHMLGALTKSLSLAEHNNAPKPTPLLTSASHLQTRCVEKKWRGAKQLYAILLTAVCGSDKSVLT
jgi:hypothetical protein